MQCPNKHIFADVRDILRGYWNTSEEQSLVYIMNNSLATTVNVTFVWRDHDRQCPGRITLTQTPSAVISTAKGLIHLGVLLCKYFLYYLWRSFALLVHCTQYISLSFYM